MRTVIAGLAMLGFLGVFFEPALAQGPNPGPGEERTAQMMKMMEQMQGQMKQMHEQMQGQMGQMKQMHEQMMGQMGGMMQQHRGEMMKACHGAAASTAPK